MKNIRLSTTATYSLLSREKIPFTEASFYSGDRLRQIYPAANVTIKIPSGETVEAPASVPISYFQNGRMQDIRSTGNSAITLPGGVRAKVSQVLFYDNGSIKQVILNENVPLNIDGITIPVSRSIVFDESGRIVKAWEIASCLFKYTK
jgi:hypothetical protein